MVINQPWNPAGRLMGPELQKSVLVLFLIISEVKLQANYNSGPQPWATLRHAATETEGGTDGVGKDPLFLFSSSSPPPPPSPRG